jgi:DNA replicative helicase MCM subunit Mcm2 (Cdc46/Mcm family)
MDYKDKVIKDILTRKDINTNIQIVTSTTMNISYDQLTKKLSLRIPKPDKIKDQSKYDPINVVLQMKQIWEQMNPKYRLYYDFNIKNLVGKVIYDFKRFFNRRPTLDDPESKSFVII